MMIIPALLLVQTPDLRRTMAANPKEAVLMAPPQAVTAAGVRQMVWTADGSFLVVLHDTSPEFGPATEELIAWGRKSGKARVLATFDPSTTTIRDLMPMGGSDRFVLDFTQKVRENDTTATYNRINLVSATSGTVVQLSAIRRTEQDKTLIDACPSPLLPIGILERIGEKDKRIRVFGVDGRLGPEIVVGRSNGFDFDAQGYPRQIRWVDDPKTGKGRAEARRIDFATGKTGEWQPWTRDTKTDEPGPLRVSTSTIGNGQALRASAILLVLKDGRADESGVVSTDGTEPLLSPKGDAIAYLDQGLAMVRTLTKVDRKVYDDGVKARKIAELIERVRQVGLAILQFTADSDDVLPGQNVDLQTKLSRYLKDDALLQGFSYTFGGGNQAEIENIVGTELGYLAGPGGRAVVYADGHTKWVPDSP